MAIVTTKAIVLSSLKYGDTSLIVKCYTQTEGVKSYLITILTVHSFIQLLTLGLRLCLEKWK